MAQEPSAVAWGAGMGDSVSPAHAVCGDKDSQVSSRDVGTGGAMGGQSLRVANPDHFSRE